MESIQLQLAKKLGELFLARGLRLATAESCTGGLLSAVITDIPGSSQWFERGIVSYSNEAKQELLSVPLKLIKEHGAVSQEVAMAMAEGLISASKADITVAITGVAGPDGGSEEKPVGTVWIAWAGINRVTETKLFVFSGDRQAVRAQSVKAALEKLIQLGAAHISFS